uniref:Uncharacterized protein n=1 Tax=Opuntia streptacantha TaxID=393608 RepID=A0A7C9AXU4_OPUST
MFHSPRLHYPSLILSTCGQVEQSISGILPSPGCPTPQKFYQRRNSSRIAYLYLILFVRGKTIQSSSRILFSLRGPGLKNMDQRLNYFSIRNGNLVVVID